MARVFLLVSHSAQLIRLPLNRTIHFDALIITSSFYFTADQILDPFNLKNL